MPSFSCVPLESRSGTNLRAPGATPAAGLDQENFHFSQGKRVRIDKYQRIDNYQSGTGAATAGRLAVDIKNRVRVKLLSNFLLCIQRLA
jgi:hypothetical protein